MSIRQVILLLALVGLCFALVSIAWASGSELYLFIPTRYGGPIHPPSTHPGVIAGLFVASLVMTYWFGQYGLYFFFAISGEIVLGSVVGFLVFAWTPTWAQHVLTVGMIATALYAWRQRDYFWD